jgi:hypothetical protein
MFLHIVGHNQRFRVAHQAWRRSIETVSMIMPPSTATHPKTMGSPRWYSYLHVYVILVCLSKVVVDSIICTYHLIVTFSSYKNITGITRKLIKLKEASSMFPWCNT